MQRRSQYRVAAATERAIWENGRQNAASETDLDARISRQRRQLLFGCFLCSNISCAPSHTITPSHHSHQHPHHPRLSAFPCFLHVLSNKAVQSDSVVSSLMLLALLDGPVFTSQVQRMALHYILLRPISLCVSSRKQLKDD
jgi:hypothetical protein